jgi:predicted ATPase
MLTINGEKTLTIQDSSQKEINLVADDLFIHANRETGSLKLIRKNRFHTMQCEVSIFTM